MNGLLTAAATNVGTVKVVGFVNDFFLTELVLHSAQNFVNELVTLPRRSLVDGFQHDSTERRGPKGGRAHDRDNRDENKVQAQAGLPF